MVRKGSTASNPQGRILDTGESLKVETLRGEAITKAGLDLKGEIEGPVQPDTEVVVIRFAPVAKGGSVRLRISETYTDPGRYRLEGDELVFDRSLGRPRNAIVLPARIRAHRLLDPRHGLGDRGRPHPPRLRERAARRDRRAAQGADDAQASSFFTTLPDTSVRRKSRPWKR